MDIATAQRKIDEAVEVAKKVFMQGKIIDTKILCTQILKCDEEEPHALQLMALAEHRSGRYNEAIQIFRRLIRQDETNPDNHNNIALSYSCVNQLDKSIAHLNKAIELRPDAGCFHSNIGLQYRNKKDYDSAIKAFIKATEILPEDVQAWNNLGACLAEMKRLPESEKAFRKAIELNPDSAMSHVDLAYNLQTQERWQEAWEHYDYRFDHFNQLQFYKTVYDQKKKWTGAEDVKGKRFLLFCEQGLGDAIMFGRYIKYIKSLGAHVLLHCYDTIEAIMKNVDGVDEITTAKIHEQEPLPEYDFHASVMSLPLLLKKYEPFYEPYFSYKKAANLTNYADTFNIGVIWAGSPLHPEDCHRSCYLREFQPICDVPGVKLFSLQKDCRPRQYRYNQQVVDFTEGSEGMRVIDATEFISDFEDVAMFLNSLDLLVSVDTAPVHLAGAMEKPVFMAVAYNNDPRWGSKDTTEWYPTVRVFRQKERGNWKEVFERIANEIRNLL